MKLKSLVQVYGIHNGKKILNYIDVSINDFINLCSGYSVVYGGRHWWII